MVKVINCIKKLIKLILVLITDFAWIFWALVAYLLFLGSADIEVFNSFSNHKFKLPGWYSNFKF